jgi:hypothetical protein
MNLSRQAVHTEAVQGAIKAIAAAASMVVLLYVGGCSPRVRVDPIEVKPIHIVHDINIRLDRQLDEFFAFQEQATTQPATNAATTQTAAGDV